MFISCSAPVAQALAAPSQSPLVFQQRHKQLPAPHSCWSSIVLGLRFPALQHGAGTRAAPVPVGTALQGCLGRGVGGDVEAQGWCRWSSLGPC